MAQIRQMGLIAIVAILASLATVAGLFAYQQASSTSAAKTTEVKTRPYHLLDAMHLFQTYATKLYFAGQARNEELASWYSWKLESTVKDVKDRHTEPYAYNGWDAAQLVLMLDTPITELNKVVKQKNWDAFAPRYDDLMNACNACHVAAEHPFVVVQAPRNEQPPQNQKFSKVGKTP